MSITTWQKGDVAGRCRCFWWSEPELVRGLMQRADVGIDGDHAAVEIYVVAWFQGAHGGVAVNEVEARAILKPVIGNRVERINRIHYAYLGEVNKQVGAVELIFHDGLTLYLDCGGDGESLVMNPMPWIDAFEPPLGAENEEFVRTHGKWTRFDVSNGKGYQDLIGKLVESVDLVLNVHGKVVGATFYSSSQILRVDVEADDLYVQLT